MFYDTEQIQGEESLTREGRTAIVVGGTQGIGKEIVRALAAKGSRVILTGRTPESAAAAAQDVGMGTTGLAVDLSEPTQIAGALAGVTTVDDLVIAAIERDSNTLDNYDVAAAIRLVTLKLVGYTEVVHSLRSRFSDRASIVLFGGLALERPYPGFHDSVDGQWWGGRHRALPGHRVGSRSDQRHSSRHHR